MDDSTLVPFFSDQPDDLKPFDFDDDNGGDGGLGLGSDGHSIPDEDIYDAINDETFGAEISAFTAVDDDDADLADFAIRTANLALLDDEPTTSAQEPPDPSQIPIPYITSNNSLHFSEKSNHKKEANLLQQQAAANVPSTNTSSIWASGSFNGIGSLGEWYAGHQLKMESKPNQHHQHQADQEATEFSQNHLQQQFPLVNFTPIIAPPPGMELLKPIAKNPAAIAAMLSSSPQKPNGPMTAEDLERQLLQEAAAVGNVQQPKPQFHPQNHMDSAELERKMFEEAMLAQQQQAALQMVQQQQQNQAAMAARAAAMMAAMAAASLATPSGPSILPQVSSSMAPATHAPASIPSGMTPPPWFQQLVQSGAMPPPPMPGPGQQQPPPPSAQLLQQWQQMFAAAAAAGAGLPPPPTGMPPMPPHFLPPGMAPQMPQQQQMPPMHPLALLQQYRDMGSGTPATAAMVQHLLAAHQHGTPIPMAANQPAPNFGQPSMPQLHMVPASLHPRVERQRRQQKGHSTLPSGKTIADYALDPYAGLMSTKEREWLIKIHIIQCLGSGDPMEDDYFYTVWKQRNVLEKAPEQVKEKPKYYSFEATFPSAGYTAPSFTGSLGRPVHCSSRIPRQIIEVTNDSIEEESSTSGKQTAAHKQKRLRALLMKIENAALMLIDCRDIRRKLRFFEETRITEFIDKSEITDRIERFNENLANVDISIFAPDQLPTVMLIQKGRQLVYDWLHFLQADGEQQQGSSQRLKMLAHMQTLLETMGKFARKVPDESLDAFAEGFCSLFTQISSQVELFSLLNAAKFELSLIRESKLVQFTLLSMLAALISTSQLATPLTMGFLQETAIAQLLTEPASTLKLHTNDELLKSYQWSLIRTWLKNGPFDGRSVAGKICQNAG